MIPFRHAALAAVFVLLSAACARDGGSDPIPASAELACQAGAWRTAQGEVFAINPVNGGLRYRMFDGRTGRLEGEPDGELAAREGWREDGPIVATARFEPCPAGRMRFTLDGESTDAARIALQVRDTRFRSGDGALGLRGRLVLPADAGGPIPLAVLVHGSGSYSAVVHEALPYLLPAHGIAVFVYDKRGSGESDGEYTQDFAVLADDAAAALAEARRLAPGAFSRAGYVGGSQGGWIGPLAAWRSPVDYVVALYGLAEGPLAEDREQVMDDLRARGHGPDVLAKARELTDATGLLMASGFTRGFDELAEVRRKYTGEAWLDDVRGEFTGQIVAAPGWIPQWAIRAYGRRRDVGTPWDYEPLPVLAALDVPQLWVIAEDDREAPPRETLARIRGLQAQGRPVDLVVFPGTDHGIVQFEESEDGTRTELRHPEGYHALVADWIRTLRLDGRPSGVATEPRQGTGAATDPAAIGTMPATDAGATADDER